MNTRPVRILALASLSVLLLFFLLVRSFVPGPAARGGAEQSDLKLVESIIQLIQEEYIDRVEPERAMEGAYRGLVQSLDMLSSYLSREDLAKYNESGHPPLRDTGIVLIKTPGGMPQVAGLEEGRPASRSGLQIGDFISAINNRPTFGLSLWEARLLMLGHEDRPVKLRVVRQASTVEIAVERSLPPAKAYQFSPEKGTAGVLTISRLSFSGQDSLKGMIPASVAQASAPLVLDLRGCGQGDLESAHRLVNVFLRLPQAGYFLMKDGSRQPFSCPEPAVWDKVPLVVWTNQATLGPAEIVAGVLQSAKRAKVLGFPTLGLASKQKLFPLSDGCALLLTTGVFCYASGEKLWEKGVVPDEALSGQEAGRSQFLQKTLSLTPLR
ncbi:MAG TPA: S41 family peptidase [Acidobacteriota bacterium]